jgi:hypothetical protein
LFLNDLLQGICRRRERGAKAASGQTGGGSAAGALGSVRGSDEGREHRRCPQAVAIAQKGQSFESQREAQPGRCWFETSPRPVTSISASAIRDESTELSGLTSAARTMPLT